MRYYLPLYDSVITTDVPLPEWAEPLYEEPNNEPNSSFAGNMQFVWDSVSISALKTCPRKYNWTIRQGYQLSPTPSTLGFGIYFHKVLEVYHKLIALHTPEDTALLRCVKLAGLLGEYLTPGRTERTKETLLRAVVWYLDQFRDDPAETTLRPNGQPAVEYSFLIPFAKIGNQQTYLAGHLDRVVRFQGHIYICDYKTTKAQLDSRFFDTFKPNTQVQGYLAAAHTLAKTSSALPAAPAGLIIDGIQLGVNFTRYQRSIITYTKLEINAFLTDLEHWIKWAAVLADAEHWPANETACSNYGGCVFRSICSETPAKHQRLLEANFTRRTWSPKEAR